MLQKNKKTNYERKVRRTVGADVPSNSSVNEISWQIKLDDGWAAYEKTTATELEQSFEKRQSAVILNVMKR